MSSWAKPGVKCVCVDDVPRGGVVRSPHPPVGVTLTIKGVSPDYFGRGVHLHISGYPNVCPIVGHDVGWRISRFSPLVTRTQSQDLALFTPLLETQGVDA